MLARMEFVRSHPTGIADNFSPIVDPEELVVRRALRPVKSRATERARVSDERRGGAQRTPLRRRPPIAGSKPSAEIWSNRRAPRYRIEKDYAIETGVNVSTQAVRLVKFRMVAQACYRSLGPVG